MATREQGKFVKVAVGEAAINVHYHEMGPAGGDTVVFVQTGGAGTTAWMCWYLNMPVFAQAGYHVYAPDSVEFGDTEIVSGPGGVRGPDFLLAFMDALSIRQAHFIGNSNGSMSITPFAAEHPERVKSFITSGGIPRLDTEAAKAIAPTLGRTERLNFVREMLSKPEVSFKDLRKATADFFYDPDHPRIDDVTQMRLEVLRRPGVREKERDAAFRQIQVGRQNFEASLLARIQAPTYLIHGRDERFFYSKEDVPLLLDGAIKPMMVIPRCDCTVLAHCAHWPQLERADTYNALCLEFLRSLRG